MKQYQLNGFGSDVKKVTINSEAYQIQAVEFEDEIFFFVRQLNEVVCMIMQDEKAEWMPDCDVCEALFQQIMKRINKLYFL